MSLFLFKEIMDNEDIKHKFKYILMILKQQEDNRKKMVEAFNEMQRDLSEIKEWKSKSNLKLNQIQNELSKIEKEFKLNHSEHKENDKDHMEFMSLLAKVERNIVALSEKYSLIFKTIVAFVSFVLTILGFIKLFAPLFGINL